MSTALTVKDRKFAEVLLRTGNKALAAREAGYSPARSRMAARELLIAKPNLQDHIIRRRALIIERYQIQTEEIVGGIVEIAQASIGDVFEPDGSFDLEKCRERGVDHLIESVETIETTNEKGEKTVRYKIKMYSRLDAYKQLAVFWGLNQAERKNQHDQKEKFATYTNCVNDVVAKFTKQGLEVPPYEELLDGISKTYPDIREVLGG